MHRLATSAVSLIMLMIPAISVAVDIYDTENQSGVALAIPLASGRLAVVTDQGVRLTSLDWRSVLSEATTAGGFDLEYAGDAGQLLDLGTCRTTNRDYTYCMSGCLIVVHVMVTTHWYGAMLLAAPGNQAGTLAALAAAYGAEAKVRDSLAGLLTPLATTGGTPYSQQNVADYLAALQTTPSAFMSKLTWRSFHAQSASVAAISLLSP